MITRTLRATAALLGAILLSVTIAGQPAQAQLGGGGNVESCPCYTGGLIDWWFTKLGPSKLQPGQLLACVNEPVLTTFDYYDRSASGRAYLTGFLVDVLDQPGTRPPRCIFDLSYVVKNPGALKPPPGATNISAEITSAQAQACRREILLSATWSAFACPNQ